jgi:hypothetical protein
MKFARVVSFVDVNPRRAHVVAGELIELLDLRQRPRSYQSTLDGNAFGARKNRG